MQTSSLFSISNFVAIFLHHNHSFTVSALKVCKKFSLPELTAESASADTCRIDLSFFLSLVVLSMYVYSLFNAIFLHFYLRGIKGCIHLCACVCVITHKSHKKNTFEFGMF